MVTPSHRRRRGCRLSTKAMKSVARLCPALLVAPVVLAAGLLANAQTTLSWDQVKTKFQTANPTLKADVLNVEEMKAEEVTAFLRPNPQLTVSTDGNQIAPHSGVWQPTKGTQVQTAFSYL